MSQRGRTVTRDSRVCYIPLAALAFSRRAQSPTPSPRRSVTLGREAAVNGSSEFVIAPRETGRIRRQQQRARRRSYSLTSTPDATLMTVSTRKRNYASLLPLQRAPRKQARLAQRTRGADVQPPSSATMNVLAAAHLGRDPALSARHRAALAPISAPPPKNTRLLDLSDDVLSNIFIHVMSPAKEGFRKIITEEGMRASLPLAKTCRALQVVWRRSMHDLELWVSGNLDDRGLLSICQGNGAYIHRLGIRKCTKLSTAALEMIPNLCPNLRSLDLSHVPTLSDTVVVELAKASGGTLHFLALHACTQLTRRALSAIARYCTTLRFLDIGAISAVDDDSVCMLARALGRTLRTLIISHCTSVSDACMPVLGASCSTLMSLTMRSLPLLTDAGLEALCRGVGERIQILDVLDCRGLTLGGYFSTMETHCPHVFRYLEESNYVEHFGERCLRDNIIATMPGLIYRISATDAFRRRPALYFLLLDESTLRPFRVSVQSKSLNLSDFGTVLISNFGKRPTIHTRHVLLERFGYDSPADDVENGCQSD